MMQHSFQINSTFLVTPDLNTLRDMSNDVTTHLDPVHMQLLCMLSANAGQVVTRETLISQIWNDYNGGDDGLKQSVTVLRKLLGDTENTLIETVQNRGYVLHASIMEEVSTTQPVNIDKIMREKITLRPKSERRGARTARVWMAASFLLLVILGFLYWNRDTVLPAEVEKLVKPKDSTEVPFEQASMMEETAENTIVTKDADGTSYKLILNGDAPPFFYINGKPATMKEMEKHHLMITNLTKVLREKKEKQLQHNQ